MNDMPAIQRRMQRIEVLIQEIRAGTDPVARARTEEVIGLLLELHGIGLARMLELVAAHGAVGDAIVQRDFVQDEYVAGLLILHGLHPVALETRVVQALDTVRPQLQLHGGNAQLVEVRDGVVRLRLDGNCQGSSSTALPLRQAIEARIAAHAPDVLAIEVEEASEQFGAPLPVMIPLQVVPAGKENASRF